MSELLWCACICTCVCVNGFTFIELITCNISMPFAQTMKLLNQIETNQTSTRLVSIKRCCFRFPLLLLLQSTCTLYVNVYSFMVTINAFWISQMIELLFIVNLLVSSKSNIRTKYAWFQRETSAISTDYNYWVPYPIWEALHSLSSLSMWMSLSYCVCVSFVCARYLFRFQSYAYMFETHLISLSVNFLAT